MVDINIYEIIMQMVNFLLLLFILNKVIYGPLIKFMTDRQNSIDKHLEYAEQEKQKAEAILEEQKNILKEVKHESIKIKEEAEKIAKRESELIIKETNKKAEAILKENEQKLLFEAENAKKGLVSFLTEATATLVTKVVKESVDKKSIDKTVNANLEEIIEK